MKINKAWYFEKGWNKVWILMLVLKQKSLYLPKNDLLVFNYFDIDWMRDYVDMHYPSVEETREIIFFLQDLSALEVDKERTYPIARREIHALWDLRIDKKVFDEVLKEVAKLTGVVIFGSETDTKSEMPNKDISYQYENHVIFFKLGDNSSDSVDFSSATVLRKIFESFLELKKRKSVDVFTPKELISIYKELFGKDITRRYLASQISNIRNKKINPKPELKERFKLEFIRDSDSWKITLY